MPDTIQTRYGFQPVKGDVGIEIEMEADSPFPNSEYLSTDWSITRDGSLRGISAEFVSRGPRLIEEVKNHLENLQKYLDKGKVKRKFSFRAGCHIHINVLDMTLDEVVNFALLYYIFEQSLVRFCGETREGNLFCLRLQDAEAPLFFLQRVLHEQDPRILSTDTIRYGALNFASIFRHGSLEFRAMETQPTLAKIEDWAHILYCLREYAKKTNRFEYAQLFSFLGPQTWLTNIIGDRVNLILHEDFDQQAVQGLRRIQHLLFM